MTRGYIALNEQPASWGRALERAMARKPEEAVRYAGAEPAQGGGIARMFVAHSWGSDARYVVELVERGAQVEGICTCAASDRNLPCWHLAAAANRAGYLLAEDIRHVDLMSRAVAVLSKSA